MVTDRIKVTLNLDAQVVRAYRVLAARKGKHDNAVVEEALRLLFMPKKLQLIS